MHLRSMPLAAIPLALGLAACTPAQTDGIDPKGKAFDKVAAEEVVTFVGTEPFWSLEVKGTEGVWTTPDNQSGTRFAVSRMAGNGGLGFTGTLDGKPFAATLTLGNCNDGMSDRRFPYVATIALGGETFEGCAYTDKQPFSGPAAP